MSDAHVSVLREEAIAALNVTNGKRYIDATAGAGGHAVEILRRGGIVLAIDTDPTAVALASSRLEAERENGWKVVRGNFRNVEAIAQAEGFDRVSGILFDLGVSSMQLDTQERGFSYRFTSAPLDLRMNQTEGETAAQLVNRVSEEALYDLFSTYGEEEHSRVIAHAIYRARTVKKLETVGDLINAVQQVKKGEHELYPTLSRVFQALRIAVNDEMGALKEGLDGAKDLLESGGRLSVISFHSLEDRIVKIAMKSGGWQVITKHPILPSEEEQAENKRSRSAKLRIAEKI